MAWTQADIDTIKQAILDRKGARSIQFSDQLVTFDSIDDMLKLLAVMQQEVNAAAGTSTRMRLAATSKGTR
jgi:hypothetical protein